MRLFLIRTAVFVSAAAVLVLEIVAGRILAPYVGVSLQTFTGIIGTILAAIALGAWAGGRLADQRDPNTLLGPVLIAGGILAVVSPALVYVVGPSVSGERPVTIVVLAAIGFFLPAAVLSMATPIAAKLSLGSIEQTGSVVGSLSALGTAGALFGTFVTGFVLIAAMPSQPITWVVGVILVALGAVFTWSAGSAAAVIGIAAVMVAITGSASVAAPCDYETAYSCAIVAQRTERPTTRALILDTFVNSVVDVEDPTYLSSRYARAADAVVQAQTSGGPRNAVYIGGGGYTLPRFYHATAGSLAVVLEIDDVLPEIAVNDLGLEDGPWLKTITGDARISLRGLAEDQFDLAVGDAFSGRSVPWHLTTVEFLGDIAARLEADGVYVINVIDHPPTEFARAQLATMAEVFEHVAVVAPPAYLEFERGGNFVLVGTNAEIRVDAIVPALTDGEVVLVDGEARAWAAEGRVLTDDYAPTDQLLSRP
jgi:spermidine synthase